eukprot:m.53835 g.53835  ORF g.53835 m.53835 type:complete len:438 (-) comp13587_c0_seq1:688-2001(-)
MSEIAAINKFTQALRGGNIDAFYAAGDELRQKLQQNGLIKDRSYRLKKYPQCFKGDEFVDYMVYSETCSSRAEAVLVGCSLVMYGIIHHVVDDHLFKDEGMFYRFRHDDGTLKADTRSYRLLTRKAIHIHAALHASGLMIKDRDYGARTFRKCFIGQELTPWLVVQELAKTKEDAIALAQSLVDEGFIHHVTNDHGFKDEYLFYRWTVDELSASAEFESFIRTPRGGSYMGHIDHGLRLVLPAVSAAFRRLSLSQRSGGSGVVVMDDDINPDAMREVERANVANMQLKGEFVFDETLEDKPPTPPPRNIDADKMLALQYDKDMTALKSAPWFHDLLTRDQAEERLKAAGLSNDGVFLVRLSQSKDRPVLSLTYKQTCWHLKIQPYAWTKSGKHGGKPGHTFNIDSGPHFVSISDMIDHYGKSCEQIPTKLVTPCPKE